MDALPTSSSVIPCPRTIALVGLMGVGKSTVGRRLAAALKLPFFDADAEIVDAAGLTIPEIFEKFGETEFRALERRVIARLLNGPAHVLATGGGALTDPQTRALLKEKAVTVWLKADFRVLTKRLGRRDDRPLLRGKDPLEVLQAQAEARYPFYAEADLTVDAGVGSQATAVKALLEALRRHQEKAA